MFSFYCANKKTKTEDIKATEVTFNKEEEANKKVEPSKLSALEIK